DHRRVKALSRQLVRNCAARDAAADHGDVNGCGGSSHQMTLQECHYEFVNGGNGPAGGGMGQVVSRMEGMVAVVTGGASGLGLEVARLFAARGVKLVLVDWDASLLEAAVADLNREGADAVGVSGDVSLERTAAE